MSGNNLLVDFLYGVVMLSLLTFGVDLTLFEVFLVQHGLSLIMSLRIWLLHLLLICQLGYWSCACWQLHETASTSGETYGGKSVNQVIRNYEKICQNLGLEDNIGIVTGNWGCGAFGGDPELKTIIQWLAASQVIVSSAVKKERKQRSSFFFSSFFKECCIWHWMEQQYTNIHSSDRIHIMYFLLVIFVLYPLIMTENKQFLLYTSCICHPPVISKYLLELKQMASHN